MSLTSVETKYEHIVLDNKGVSIIAGTNMKVIELVLEKSAYVWSPEELHFQHSCGYTGWRMQILVGTNKPGA